MFVTISADERGSRARYHTARVEERTKDRLPEMTTVNNKGEHSLDSFGRLRPRLS